MKKNNQIVGVFITLLGGLFWGLSGACGQYLFENSEITAKWLVPVRLIIAGTLSLSFFLIRHPKKSFVVWKNKRDALDVILYGIVGIMLCQYTYFATIELSNAGIATILQYVSPIFIMLTLCVIDKKAPTIIEILTVICAMAGIFLLATHGNLNQLVISKAALVTGLISALTVTFYNIQPRRLMTRFSAPFLLGWAMFIGGIVLCAVFKPWNFMPIIGPEEFAALFAIIVLGTIVGFSLYMQGVKMIGPTKAIIYASIEPVSAAVLATLWLGASFTMIDLFGFILIMGAIFILTIFGKK